MMAFIYNVSDCEKGYSIWPETRVKIPGPCDYKMNLGYIKKFLE